jgi:hypothetical protein
VAAARRDAVETTRDEDASVGQPDDRGPEALDGARGRLRVGRDPAVHVGSVQRRRAQAPLRHRGAHGFSVSSRWWRVGADGLGVAGCAGARLPQDGARPSGGPIRT